MTDLTLDIAPTALKRPDARIANDTLLGLPTSMPLVLDLDGTLIEGDLLYKSFVSILRRNPLILLACAGWLLRGRAALKRQLALRNRIDWDRLELRQDIVALASREKAAGRTVVLATAADAMLAGRLASRLPFIDHVFASDGKQNLKGPIKAELLCRMFQHGFIYAGDSKADLAVWVRARGIVLVNVHRAIRDAALALGRPTLELSAGTAGRS